MGKTVLIIGNGFDLAHGLPTRYSDFLNFCNAVCAIQNFKINENGVENYDKVCQETSKCVFFSDLLKQYFIKRFELKNINNNHLKKISFDYNVIDLCIIKMLNLLENNIWYKYLYELFNNNCLKGENWIDFESEISFIIETIDKNVKNITYNWHIVDRINPDNIDFSDKFKIFRKIIDDSLMRKPGTVKNVRKRIYDDLNDIISALEIYLSEFVEKLIKPNKLKLIDEVAPDSIINFNYTHTYQNTYCGDDCEDVFHIHGELNHKPNNMVLGIDEYWSKKERNKHTNFTIFKKFAQRIQKNVGIENYNWFDKILHDYKKNSEIASIYIFGHSLDVTDKDILRDYLKSAATEVTIYCKDKETEGEYIANIIQMIGEKRLLEKVNQYPQKLKFVVLDKSKSDNEEEEEKEPLTSGAAT